MIDTQKLVKFRTLKIGWNPSIRKDSTKIVVCHCMAVCLLISQLLALSNDFDTFCFTQVADMGCPQTLLPLFSSFSPSLTLIWFLICFLGSVHIYGFLRKGYLVDQKKEYFLDEKRQYYEVRVSYYGK